MAKKHPPRYVWRRKPSGEEWTPESVVSEAELLNRVILTKALMAYASNQTMSFKTDKEYFKITPRVARDVMRASGQYPDQQNRNKPARKDQACRVQGRKT